MKFEPYIERGGRDENGFFKPTQMGTKLIPETAEDLLLIEQLVEYEKRREAAWIDFCLKGLYNE